MQNETTHILYAHVTEKQKNFIEQTAFDKQRALKRKVTQSEVVRTIIDWYLDQHEDEPSIKNQDLGDEPTLPGEDDFI